MSLGGRPRSARWSRAAGRRSDAPERRIGGVAIPAVLHGRLRQEPVLTVGAAGLGVELGAERRPEQLLVDDVRAPQRRAQPPPGERAHHRRPRGRRGAASQAPPRLALLLLGLLALAGIIALIAALGGDDDGDAGRGAGNLSAGGTQLLP